MKPVRTILVPALLAAAAGQALAQSVAQNDIAVAWSLSSVEDTIQLFSAPTGSPPMSALKADPWNQTGFIEFPVWDNTDGIQHNPNGHLLGLDFGTTAGGFQLFYYPSGASTATPAPLFNAGSAPNWNTYSNLTLTRGGGIAVSPDNTQVAIGGYASGQLIVFGYDAAAGAITSANQTNNLPTLFNANRTPGVGWLDNTHALLFAPDGRLWTIDTSDPNFPATLEVTVQTPNTGVSESASLAYIPQVAPYIYVAYSTFTGTGGNPPNTTINQLSVVDPRTTPWTVVRQIDLSTSANTLRGIALDSHGNLFLSQFAGTNAFPSIQMIAGASDPASLMDNSSVVVYNAGSQVFTSNFNYLDVAAGVGGGTGPSCYANCDGGTQTPFLNVNDFICFQGKFAAGDTYANCDLSTQAPVLNVNDFICFQGKFAAGCSAP